MTFRTAPIPIAILAAPGIASSAARNCANATLGDYAIALVITAVVFPFLYWFIEWRSRKLLP